MMSIHPIQSATITPLLHRPRTLRRVMVHALCLATACLLAAPAHAQQPDTLLYSLFDPGTAVEIGARQGASVAVDGNFAVVGTSLADAGALNAGVVKVYNVTTGALLHTLPNPTPGNTDQFGVSVAVSGSRVVVGANLDDTGGINAGSAYVYDLSSARPTVPVAVLNNPGLPPGGSRFGTSVAISGSVVAIGASLEDTGASNAGSAYVYDLNSVTPTVPVAVFNNPSPATDDQFGSSIAVSGSRVVIGASRDDTGARNSGSAYVYDVSSATPTVPVGVFNNPTPAIGDQFGYSVAISGNRVVVGAFLDDSGASNAGSVYVYDLSGATPTVPSVTLNNPNPAAGDQFGYSVAVSSTRVVVGVNLDDSGAVNAGTAYVYQLSGPTPTAPLLVLGNPSPASSDQFGISVAIADSRVVVGASLDDSRASNSGSAYAYDLASVTPRVPVAVLNDPNPASNDQFGISVATSGSLVVVGASRDDAGASNAGRAYVYNLMSVTPTVPVLVLNNPSPFANDQFGNSVAVSGRRVVVGAMLDDTGAVNTGSAYVYDLDSVTPAVPVAVLNNPNPAGNDQFGFSVAVSGGVVAVGANLDDFGAINTGRVYVYDVSSASPTVPLAVLNNPKPARYDQFGSAVAVSGRRVVIGASLDDAGATNAGSAYVYGLDSETPTAPVIVLDNPRPTSSDQFGISVGISGNRVVVGASLDDAGARNAGSAYVYDLGSAKPAVPVAVLNNPKPANSDQFGYSVAISGDRVVIGANLDDTGAINSGSACVYDLSGAKPTQPVAVLNNPSPANADHFGASVAIDGLTVVVGARFDDTAAYDRGVARIFAPGAAPTVSIGTGSALTGGELPVGTTVRSFTSPDVMLTGGRVLTPTGAKLDAVFNTRGEVLLHSQQTVPVDPASGGMGRIAKLRSPTGDAVLATLVRTAGVSALNDQVIFTGLLSGTPRPAVRKGQEIPDFPGVQLKSFLSLDGNGTTTFFTGKLKGAGVTDTNNTATFAVGPSGFRMLVRQGMLVDSRPIKSLTTLVGSAGTLAEGRWRGGPDELGVRVIFAGGTQALYQVPADATGFGDWLLIAESGQDATPDLPGAKLERFNLPAYAPGAAIFESMLQLGLGGITRENNGAVFDGQGAGLIEAIGLRRLVQQSNPVPSSAGNPAVGSRLSRTRSVLAGLDRASTVIGDVTQPRQLGAMTSIFDAREDGPLRQIARAGDPAPGGGCWDRFISVAKPDGQGRGALILATLKISLPEGITPKNRTALYAVDSDGYLRRMLRTGDILESAGPGSQLKAVKTISALTSAPGSVGAARGYDSNGRLTARVTFADRTQALVTFQIP